MFGSPHARARVARLSWCSLAGLGAAIGLLMAAESVADTVLWRPFASQTGGPVIGVFARHAVTGRERELVSFAVFKDWQSRATVFESLSGYQLAAVNLLGDPAAINLRAAAVAEGFFQTVQASPARGRGFVAGEHQAARATVCVISDTLWRTRFGSASSVVGSTLRLEVVHGSAQSGVFTIVGIAPPTFR